MSYLIGTHVISELVRSRPDAGVLGWLPDEALFLNALTLGEIWKGVEKLACTCRREKLRDWFGPRILPVGPDVTDHWGRLLAQADRPVPAIDSLLAATALRHDLRLVTRNTRNFAYAGLDVINP